MCESAKNFLIWKDFIEKTEEEDCKGEEEKFRKP